MGTAGAGPRPPASEYAASHGNVLGRMTALTLMTPVRKQWLWFLRLGGTKLTVPGTPPYFVTARPRLVTMRGGAYLFQPSMTALRHLAG